MSKSDYKVICRSCDVEVLIAVNPGDIEKWKGGELIQNAMPYLTADEREILISGYCGDCFDEMFQNEDDESRNYPGPTIQEQQVYNQSLKR